ncbi:MAG: mechanosensitive ion channel family protein [Chloroflexi bacterium]|nr:MAG: mechanosensitive ion channel family protein [Chloroflexota bacterium]MBL1192818.1 mechanosensitive ion channel family protein [Chloroflexota bacterium]NOH10111.1 mechanosensitive ion channel family protein [Chloroflexota bacterium]
MDETLQNVMAVLVEWWQMLLTNIPQLLTALLVLVVAVYLARFIRGIVSRGLQHRKADQEISILLSRITQWSVIGLGILLAADQAGVDITALLTGLGIVGFTIGFALQDVSKNFVAGLLLLILQPFDIGDTIEVAGYTGSVTAINLRDTQMTANNGLHVSIPNADVFTSSLINYTRVKRRLLDISLGVAYDSDLELVRRTAIEAIRAIPGVEEEVNFRFDSFGATAIQVKIFYWYQEGAIGYNAAVDEGISRIKMAFDAAGIVIPVSDQAVVVNQAN